MSAVSPLPTDDRLDVRPGDRAAETAGASRLAEFAVSRDPVLREQIILAYLGLADRLVPFAVASVVGELKRHLRDTSWRLHVPRPRKEQALRLLRTADELSQALGHPPTASELANHLKLTEAEVLEAWEAAETRVTLSLDRPLGDGADLSVGDLVVAPSTEDQEDLLVLADLVAELPELERRVVVMRFFQDLNQSAIAARIGYSQMHVSRLLRRALARMRAQLVEP